MVELPGGGFRVPARFRRQLRKRVRRVWVRAAVEVEVVDGEPQMRALALWGENGEPLSAAVLSVLGVTDILHRAVQQEAIEHTPMLWEPAEDGAVTLGSMMAQLAGQQAADEHAALTAARSATNRRRITQDLLRRVLATYDAEGIGGLTNGPLHYSERNARRLLARARKELQQ